MLGKLFNLGTGAGAGASATAQPSQKPVSSLESVQEDIHTRNLLFPDAQALYQHRHDQVYPLSSASPLPPLSSTAFDYTGDLELEARDVRVIIMQDALSSVTASLLYDSQPPPPVPASSGDRPFTMAGTSHFTFQEPRRTPTSPRKPSLTQGQRPVVVQPGSPQLRQGAFDRRPSVHSRNQSLIENESQRAWREYREELTTFSSCIFGNSELMAYKGTSTKVHVVPSEQRPSESSASIIRDGRGSVGRSNLRSSRLSQSFSSEHVPPFNAPPTPSSAPRLQERKKVLITRLFPVNLPTDEDAASTPQNRFSDDNAGYLFPMTGEDSKTKKKKAQPKQKRTPMYAVALIINLPRCSAPIASATVPRSGFRGPGSYTEQDSFPSSFNSARRSGWSMAGQAGGFGFDSFDSTFSTDMEDRMDAITQHWDIIMRTLTHLQSVLAITLFTMLRHIDLASADPFPSPVAQPTNQLSRTTSLSGTKSEDGTSVKLPKTNAKHLNLLPNCLMENRCIGAEVDLARTRIVAGLRATRAVTGQNRWGIWREEARWIAKWAGGREQGFFFFNILTGFLATHTDWLQALAPPSYRRRHFLQQKARADEDASLPARTVIVARDKMAARRLVFLLSAFLPANQHVPNVRAHRPSTAASFGTLSQSPPSYVVPILKEESLRRKINRRTGPRRVSHSRNVSLQGQARAGGVPPTLAHLSMEGRHERRSSDASSIRTTNLPIPGSDPANRKSSAFAAAAITAETSIPHFSTAHRSEAFRHRRPGSSGSMATDDLKRLARDDSAGQDSLASSDSRQSSRWGSVISGLWSARRRESGSTAMDARSTPGARSNEPSSPIKKSPPRAEPPSGMVSEARMARSAIDEQMGDASSSPSAGLKTPLTPRKVTVDLQTTLDEPVAPSKTERVPDPSGAFESPVKTSINLDDGIIDVDVPFPDYLTSFETAVSSPSSSGFLSTPGMGSVLDAFEQSSRLSTDGDEPLNVAGWLQHYHPDFVLQAVPAQDDLLEQVKASLRAEPSPFIVVQPILGDSSVERWMDISTAIIADTTTFTITRIRYRRLVKPKPMIDRGTPPLSSSVNTYNSALQTPATSTYELPPEDEFIEERIVTLDEVLIEAVERVIAFSADTSKGSSAASSRSASKIRERSNSESTQSDEARPAPAALSASQEVPRAQCKTVILSALEEIVREAAEVRDREQLGQCNGSTTGREKESALRGAVRAWLESIDLSD
ncbi:folliculin-interacting protein N-terminus-domain-containing protein [Phialemonium atrogriseum]|uniref:Folliculin-interacting protein N-terminus-domain-containing protein n=1 Tax=Phialemonium atrogriseum TaxID=1093897 RepID=A0AAJ0FGI8_9PEZI|nr:folliculin-interacting protein N-terminus-domain-containing protein [Phialemonium atrogriseum]KAK1766662.1 folliculin-interacting protein N-terminus-domain-containing protein [Phialemonium atrogriseum]